MLSIAVPLRVTGPATAEQAWQRYEFLPEWSRWAPQITGVRADSDRLAAGLTGEVLGPFGVAVPFEVLQMDPARMRWSWRVRFGPLAFVLDHDIAPLPDGCATTLCIHGFAPAVLTYAPLARVALAGLVRE